MNLRGYDAWKTNAPDPGTHRDPPDPGCKYCEARDDESHADECPLFLPICRCGRPAVRAVHGVWQCGNALCKAVRDAR